MCSLRTGEERMKWEGEERGKEQVSRLDKTERVCDVRPVENPQTN